ncbi:MAG: helix-turn-helix transcriptional regulator [Agriterribacter sp.]
MPVIIDAASMQIETFYPIDSRLKSCIEYYYFFKSDSADFISNYFAFPNTMQALNIHKNISYKISGHTVKVKGIAENNFKMLLQGKFENPLYVQLSGKLDKITIIFKPLGLNHFIKSPFNEIAAKPTQPFLEWEEHKNHSGFLGHFFSESHYIKRVEILEKYLLLHYHTFENRNILDRSLISLCDVDSELSIEEIAGRINLTTRTFNRMFKQHLGISPIGYKKISKFRHSLKNKLFNQQFEKLTAIGYNSNFYDQSYFIKVYKKLTNLPPGKFFKEIDILAEDNLILKFIDN